MAYLYSGVITNCVLQFYVSGIAKVTSPFVVHARIPCATIPVAPDFERQAVD
jgi:hypothetical protein